MIRTQLYIPDELYAKAKAIAALKGINISQFVRESLAEHIAAERGSRKKTKASGRKKPLQSPLAGLVGKYSLGKDIVTDIARNHNDIYDL